MKRASISDFISEFGQAIKTRMSIFKKILPFTAFVVPNIILYFLDPFSFEKTWKGRTYYLFFLWIIFLETILRWEELKNDKIRSIKSLRGITFIVAFLTPTLYVIAENFFGLNAIINGLAIENNIEFALKFPEVIPLSIEYLVFTVLFAVIIVLEYGGVGLKKFSVSTFFLGTTGTVYMIDNLYSAGFIPFQILVPTTAILASKTLNFMGYHTILDLSSSMPKLTAQNQSRAFEANIGWPCAGIDSLLIYSVTIVLFLGNLPISRIKKVIYFLVGAIITYFINILRIVSIFIIGINSKGDVWSFHDYYGPLYSVTWIVTYPLIIVGSQALWRKIKNWKATQKPNSQFQKRL